MKLGFAQSAWARLAVILAFGNVCLIECAGFRARSQQVGQCISKLALQMGGCHLKEGEERKKFLGKEVLALECFDSRMQDLLNAPDKYKLSATCPAANMHPLEQARKIFSAAEELVAQQDEQAARGQEVLSKSLWLSQLQCEHERVTVAHLLPFLVQKSGCGDQKQGSAEAFACQGDHAVLTQNNFAVHAQETLLSVVSRFEVQVKSHYLWRNAFLDERDDPPEDVAEPQTPDYARFSYKVVALLSLIGEMSRNSTDLQMTMTSCAPGLGKIGRGHQAATLKSAELLHLLAGFAETVDTVERKVQRLQTFTMEKYHDWNWRHDIGDGMKGKVDYASRKFIQDPSLQQSKSEWLRRVTQEECESPLEPLRGPLAWHAEEIARQMQLVSRRNQ
ncbi:unnamed protein product [Amoebophrya sp. A120]|nr:unnamed protein product [Amoebophrya sp. A120]|eukprot:GSA120T00018852001.1